MKSPTRALSLVLCLTLGTAACNKAPAKPTIAIGTPRLLEPAQGAQIANLSQPVTLVVENATTTGTGALTYTFEVATDDQFTNKVFSKDRVVQGTDGRTRQPLDRLEPGRSYVWRARAEEVGASLGSFGTSSFSVGAVIRLDPPVLVAPASGVTVEGYRPALTFANAGRSGPVGAVVYRIELAENDQFSPLLLSSTVAEQPGQTSFTLPSDLLADRSYYWRVRAADPASGVDSGFTAARAFRTRTAGIDLARAIFVKGPNIKDWAETSRITRVSIGDREICVDHTRLGLWPSTDFFDDPGTQAEGNFGFCMNTKYSSNGDGVDQWYCAAAFWNRPGQSCKGETAETLKDTWYQPNEEPFRSWVPRSGEPFGIYMTTPARFWPNMRTVDERTNILLMQWP